MVWPTLGSRKANEQNRTDTTMPSAPQSSIPESDTDIRNFINRSSPGRGSVGRASVGHCSVGHHGSDWSSQFDGSRVTDIVPCPVDRPRSGVSAMVHAYPQSTYTAARLIYYFFRKRLSVDPSKFPVINDLYFVLFSSIITRDA